MQTKQIKDFENYSVREDGLILNSKGKALKIQKNIDGYNVVSLRRDGKGNTRRLNRLLATAFIPNPFNLPIVNHIDHVRDNDSLENLEWCTIKENAIKSVELYPEKWKGNATITQDIAKNICEKIQEGNRNKEISEELNVSMDIIKDIREGLTWKEISCDYELMSSKRAVSKNTVIWVCHQIKAGLKNREILAASTCDRLTKSIVKRIRGRKCWKEISINIF